MKTTVKIALENLENKEVRESTIVVLKDSAPKWVVDMARDAHGGMMPDNYRFQFIKEALTLISEALENDTDPREIELEADIYTRDLLAWVASNLSRTGFCDEAMENGCDTFVASLQGGQLFEKHEVLSSLIDTLESLNDDEIETRS